MPTNVYAKIVIFIQRKYFCVVWSVLRHDGSLSTQYRTHIHISWTQFAVLVCLYIYRPDDDLVDVETCRRNISDKFLFVTDYAACWIKCYAIAKCIFLVEVPVNSVAHCKLIPFARKNIIIVTVMFSAVKFYDYSRCMRSPLCESLYQ